ncbi:MAG: multiheme c-type cytochrome [Candidatus Binatia bacterium]
MSVKCPFPTVSASGLLARIARRFVFAALVLCATVPAVGAATDSPGAGQAEAPRLPAFEGRTLDGKPLSSNSFPGKRLVLLCFNPGIDQSVAYAQALARVAPERLRHNFAIVGVAMGLDSANARQFAARHKLDFPILDDSDGQIGATLGLQSPIMLVGSDAEGRVGLAVIGTQAEDGPTAAVLEGRVREFLRLPVAGAVVDGKLEELPMAPPFTAERLDGGAPMRLSDLSGKPVVLMFFMSGCSHCQEALRFFKSELARLPDASRPAFVGIANDTRSYTVESTLKDKGIDFFPVLTDADRKIATAYGSFARVPDIVLIDAAGRILYRNMGWEASHDPDLMRMRLARLTGAKVPMLLSRTGFSGNDACAVCHEAETATWRFTSHAFAFDTLVKRAAERDPKCVGCHVVGFGETGGYSETVRQEHLEDVGCETCHGKGGGHLESKATAGKGATDYRAACVKCHDAKHSLGFEYETFLPKVSHAVIASLDAEQRAKRISERDRPRDLLPKTSDFVGSAACQSCHEREYGIWSGGPHAHSMETLRKKGRQGDAKCVSCHVTGYGRPGGFPENAVGGQAAEDLARVGCESCHGPGAQHVAAGGKQPAGIVKLGDKCDSCVILQICGSCHDDANDPGFRFNVERKIEAQRHGATPPVSERSTGK